MPPMKYPEIVADKLHASGWSWVYCSAVTADGWRWIVDAHREGSSLHRRSLGKIDVADYFHSESSIIGCSDFLKSLHDTSTLELSQRLDHSHIEGVSILGRKIGLPEPSADSDF